MLASLLTLFQGLAFFLYGMMILSGALQRMAGGQLERILKRATFGRIRGLLLGVGMTALLQSSSALTVMLVGLVNSGVMELRQTIGVIMGSNIGTTLTAWFLALTGLESNDTLSFLFDPQALAVLAALTGVFLAMISSHPQRRDVGHMLAGCSLPLFGMQLMTNAVSPLADTPLFYQWALAIQHPLAGLVIGAVFTAVIQSSAASIGMLQALALAQPISYATAIPIIMGQNIGTCATALLSSIGTSRSAKQVAVLHTSFNLIGALVGLLLLSGSNHFIPFSFLASSVSPAGIALCHTLFNAGTTLLLLPFPSQLESFVVWLVPDPPRKPVQRTSRSAPHTERRVGL